MTTLYCILEADLSKIYPDLNMDLKFLGIIIIYVH